jgi:hypothetical protein
MQGLAIGAGLAQGLAGFGKAYLDTVNTFEDNALKREQIAISREAAAMKKQEYEEGLKPVKVSEFSRGMAPEMWQPIYETAKNMGIVKGQGQDEYFHKRDLQEFGENLKNNSIAKAQLLSKSMELLDKERGEYLQKALQAKETIEKFQNSWDAKYQKLQMEADETSKKLGKKVGIDYNKEKALNEEKAAFIKEGHLDRFKEYSKISTNITARHFLYQEKLDLLDDQYKEDAKKYGREDALRLHQNLVNRASLDRKHERMKLEEKYDVMENYQLSFQKMLEERRLAEIIAKEEGIRNRPQKTGTPKQEKRIIGSETGQEQVYTPSGDRIYKKTGQPIPDKVDMPKTIGASAGKEEKQSFLNPGKKKEYTNEEIDKALEPLRGRR